MERKDQLRNVAFGGSWSEQIAASEALEAAIDTLDDLASHADMMDPQSHPAAVMALDMATVAHPKADMLRKAWMRAAARPEPANRVAELLSIVGRIREAQKGRLPANTYRKDLIRDRER